MDAWLNYPLPPPLPFRVAGAGDFIQTVLISLHQFPFCALHYFFRLHKRRAESLRLHKAMKRKLVVKARSSCFHGCLQKTAVPVKGGGADAEREVGDFHDFN